CGGRWTRDGGPTDLHNIIGLCPRCHARVHTGTLTIEPDGHRGFTFTTTNRAQHKRRLEDHARIQREKLRTFLRRLTRDAGLTPTRPTTGTGVSPGANPGPKVSTTPRFEEWTGSPSPAATRATRPDGTGTPPRAGEDQTPPPRTSGQTSTEPPPRPKTLQLRPRIHART
ncbi:UNVERIFIED_CONTAM: hypothetical protein LK11_58080, partial [Mumia flava]